MKIQEFKTLSENEKVQLVNERLGELVEQKMGLKNFKNEKLDFNYTTAVKELAALGYARTKDAFEKEVKLSAHEISFLKNLAYGYEFVMSRKNAEPVVKRRLDDQVVTTSVRMHSKVWKRFQEFAKDWNIYNSVDIMASALEEYMNQFDFDSYDDLVAKTKIVEDEKK